LITCRPGDCGVKLAESEIRRVRAALAGSESSASAAVETFREILLGRVLTYLSGGLRALPPYYYDQRRPFDVAHAFERFVRQSAYLDRAPRFRSLLFAMPSDNLPATSFLYWAVEDFGLRPVIRSREIRSA
jgi:hypothetical protein